MCIGVNIVSIGTLTLSLVHPHEVFKPAILLNACAIIAVHKMIRQEILHRARKIRRLPRDYGKLAIYWASVY